MSYLLPLEQFEADETEKKDGLWPQSNYLGLISLVHPTVLQVSFNHISILLPA